MGSGQSPSQIVSELMNSNAAVKITGRIHLFTLLFEVRKAKLRVLILDLLMFHAEYFMFPTYASHEQRNVELYES
jgi:hypothetical protein